MTTAEIIRFFEEWAPSGLAEDYDNVGLLVGHQGKSVNKVLVSLDATEEVVEEAKAKGCDLLISHHPILFKGLKRLNGQNYAARCVEAAVRSEIGLLAVHTNLDHVQTGVNRKLAEKLGLDEIQVLKPLRDQLQNLIFFVPETHKNEVLEAVNSAGAGHIGKYSHCSFSLRGKGRFLPEEGSDPYMGVPGTPVEADEVRVEVILPRHRSGAVLKALKKSHPYEEVPYFLLNTENDWQDSGAGMVGNFPEPMDLDSFISKVKSALKIPFLKHTRHHGKEIRRVALCGGSGFFLLSDAKASGADVFLTSDIKYHEFFDAEGKIVLMDVGHFESEQFTSELIMEKLSIQFPNIAVLLSETKTNPVFYA